MACRSSSWVGAGERVCGQRAGEWCVQRYQKDPLSVCSHHAARLLWEACQRCVIQEPPWESPLACIHAFPRPRRPSSHAKLASFFFLVSAIFFFIIRIFVFVSVFVFAPQPTHLLIPHSLYHARGVALQSNTLHTGMPVASSALPQL